MTYPVIPQVPPLGGTTSGTLQNAQGGTSSVTGVTLNVVGMATVTFTVVPANSFGGTVNFKGSADGTNYVALLATKLGTTTVASSSAAPSAAEIWVAEVSGLTSVEAPLSNMGANSGTVTVTAVGSAIPNAVPVGSTIGTAVIQANSGQGTTATADGATAANILLAAMGKYNGATIDRQRIITKFIQLDAQSITHATPVDVYTPTTGKKFRILGYNLSTTVAGAIQFEDTTGTEVLRTPLLLAAAPFASGDMGNGYLSTAANNHLFLDVTVTGAVTGWIGICEE